MRMMKEMKKVLFAAGLSIMCLGSARVMAEDIDFTQATEIELGVKTSGNIAVEKEKDYFVFKATGENSYYELNVINTNITGWTGVRAFIWNEDHSELLLEVTAGLHSTNTGSVKLEGNKNYYIEVGSAENELGDYKITLTEVQDDGMDSMETATKISVKKTYSNKIEELGDKDWFYFKTSNDTDVYSIKLINKDSERGIKVQVYDEDGVRVNDSYIVEQQSSNVYTYKLDKNAKYYLEFSGENSVRWESIGSYKYTILKTMVLNKTSVDIKKDSATKIKAVFSGDTNELSSIKWASSNKKVVTVNSNGTIKGISKGKAKITCKYVFKDGTIITRTCTVNVK